MQVPILDMIPYVDIADKFGIRAGVLELFQKAVSRIVGLKSVEGTSCDLHCTELFS